MRQYLFGILGLGAVCLLFWYSQSISSSAPSPARPAAAVRVQSVTLGELSHSLSLTGRMQAVRSVAIRTEADGRLVTLPPAPGSVLPAGVEILRLDDRQQQATLREIQAYWQNEQRKLRDMLKLAAQGVVPRHDVENQQSLVLQAQARHEQAESQLALRQIRAPFSGTVGLHHLTQGALVKAGETLLYLDDLSRLRLDLAVPERYLSRVQPGMRINAVTEAWPGQVFHGQLVALDSRMDESTLTLNVRVEFDNPDGQLKPGLLMQASLAFPAPARPLIPAQSILYQGDERYVFVLHDQQVARRPVTLGEQQAAGVSVLSGLDVNELLVVEGGHVLQDGQRVRVISPPASSSEAT